MLIKFDTPKTEKISRNLGYRGKFGQINCHNNFENVH